MILQGSGLAARCLECLREPCLCKDHSGMKIDDDTLIDFATCSNKGIRLTAEITLRKRHPAGRQRMKEWKA